MAESEDVISSKRKASAEDVEDVTGKRAKFEDRTDIAPPSNDRDTEMNDGSDGAPPIEKDRHTQGSPTTADRVERQTESRRSPEARRPSASGGPPVRRNVSLEEKKRGQRLFGGLVSTLSRTTSGSQQQKRLEIERRQHEKAQQRRAEDEKRRAERLEQLKRTRQIEQVKLDERVMETRHSTMLAKAHSLQTRSEPKLYYLPWERTKEQEDIIRDQIRTAEETIDRERRDFKTRKEQRLRELGVTPPPRSPSPSPRQQQQQLEPDPETEPRSENATVGEHKPPPQDANPDVVAAVPSKARTDSQDKDHDENGDEMMQDEEDIVIY